jgi:hypothetical protein
MIDSLPDAHPNAIVAHELYASRFVERDSANTRL